MAGLKYLKENDYSFIFVRIGNYYDDYEKYIYNSQTRENEHLDSPLLIRRFDDDYNTQDMILSDNVKKEKDIEIT